VDDAHGTDGRRDEKHGRNGREYGFPELPNFSVDGYCPQTNTVFEFFDCFWHGHKVPAVPRRQHPER